MTQRHIRKDQWLRCEASHQAMGTLFKVVLYGMRSSYLREAAEDIFREIDQLDDQLSHYKPTSEISKINRIASCEIVVVEPGLFKVLETAMRYSCETEGAFDITVGPLINAWGFFRGRPRLPPAEELVQLLDCVGYSHVKLNRIDKTIRFDRPGIKLDLGGIGKGYTIDRCVDILRSYEIENALIWGGSSSVYALGAPPGKQGWKISIRHPILKNKTACTVCLRNLSLSISGNYEQFFEYNGKVYTHIVDPRTGLPVENMLSMQVIAPLSVTSDAISTSLFVLGVDKGRQYLKHHPRIIAFAYLQDSIGTIQRMDLGSILDPLSIDCFASIHPDF